MMFSARAPMAARPRGDYGFSRFRSFPGDRSENNSREDFIMRLAAEKELAHIGASQGAADHDHDMIHELSKRLDALWRYDQYIANAEGHIDLQNFWHRLKTQE